MKKTIQQAAAGITQREENSFAENHTQDKPYPNAQASGTIEKVLLEVNIAGHKEWVTASIDGEKIKISTTAENSNGPHVQSALKFLAQEDPSALTLENPTPLNERNTSKESRRSIHPPSISALPPPVKEDFSTFQELCQALKGVVLSLIRTGTLEAKNAPSVTAAINRFVESSPHPIPLGIARWHGRIQTALEQSQHETLIQLLHAATTFIQALQTQEKTTHQNKIMTTWLGAHAIEEESWTIWERTLIEIGRERLDGMSRASIERRYLFDTTSGALYTEERSCSFKHCTPISVGPCPRIIQVGLAEVEPSPHPRTIHLLQYSVAAEPSPKHWNSIANQIPSDFSHLETLYVESLQTYSALCEPFVLVQPASFEIKPGLHLLDPQKKSIPISCANNPGLSQQLKQIVQKHAVQWISGRLIDSQGVLMLAPISLRVFDGKHARFIRLT